MFIENVKKIWERQRTIWLTTYAFLTGFNCGRANWLGALMFTAGMVGVYVFTQRLIMRVESSSLYQPDASPPVQQPNQNKPNGV
jgi:hypothetical protein